MVWQDLEQHPESVLCPHRCQKQTYALGMKRQTPFGVDIVLCNFTDHLHAQTALGQLHTKGNIKKCTKGTVLIAFRGLQLKVIVCRYCSVTKLIYLPDCL